MAEVSWSARSLEKLAGIYDYIDSKVYAERLITSIMVNVESQLGVFPNSGRWVPELYDTPLSFLREVIYKGYRIIYDPRNAPEKVHVITVFNSRMELKQKTLEWIIPYQEPLSALYIH